MLERETNLVAQSAKRGGNGVLTSLGFIVIGAGIACYWLARTVMNTPS
jgi:hypothetical protein